MPYTIEEIREMRKKMMLPKAATAKDITEETVGALDMAPAMIDQLLEEREAMRKKVEGMKSDRQWENGKCSECGEYSPESKCGVNDEVLNEVLRLFQEWI